MSRIALIVVAAALAAPCWAQAPPPADAAAPHAVAFTDYFALTDRLSAPVVGVQLREATLPQTLRTVFDEVEDAAYELNAGARRQRLTLETEGIRLTTLLDLISQAFGVEWRREVKDGRTLYRITEPQRIRLSSLGARPEEAPAAFEFTDARLKPVFDKLVLRPEGSAILDSQDSAFRIFLGEAGDDAATYRIAVAEEVSAFTCPHCNVRVLAQRDPAPPKCVKCSRQFQAQWQFCPFDGAPRPIELREWSFCPACGKRVNVTRALPGQGDPTAKPSGLDTPQLPMTAPFLTPSVRPLSLPPTPSLPAPPRPVAPPAPAPAAPPAR